MTEFNRTAPAYGEPVDRTAPVYGEPVDRTAPAYGEPVNPTAPTYSEPVRMAVAPRMAMTTTGPMFSSLDMVAGVLVVLMNLGPLAMAAFAVGRY